MITRSVLIVLAVLAVVAGVVAAAALQPDTGFVIIGVGGKVVQMSFAVFVVLLLVLFACLMLALRLFASLGSLPARLRAWQSERTGQPLAVPGSAGYERSASLARQRMRDARSDAELGRLSRQAYRLRIEQATAEEARTLWEKMPRTLRADPALAAVYAARVGRSADGNQQTEAPG